MYLYEVPELRILPTSTLAKLQNHVFILFRKIFVFYAMKKSMKKLSTLYSNSITLFIEKLSSKKWVRA